MGYDDTLQLLFDTYHNGRSGYVFIRHEYHEQIHALEEEVGYDAIPTARIQALLDSELEAPVVMLNLLKFAERAGGISLRSPTACSAKSRR